MSSRRIFVFFAAVVLLCLGGTAEGQTCQQGGYYPICGPTCSMYYNLVYDPGFDQTNCWSFDSGAGRYTSDGACHWWSDTHGRVNGPTNGWKSIYQYTAGRPVNQYGDGDYFTFAYDLEMDDPNGTVEIWVGHYPNQWTLVDTKSGLQCGTFSVNLGEQPAWANNALMIVLSANLPTSGKTAKFDQIALDQFPQ